MTQELLEVRNPHSVLAALAARPHDVAEVCIARNTATPAWKQVADVAAGAGVRIRPAARPEQPGRSRRGKSAPDRSERSGGTLARIRPREPMEIDRLFQLPSEDIPQPRIWLALEYLQDPHNVGAIWRTAGFFGVQGLILTKDRSAPISSTVYDIASGGLESVPFCVQSSLSRCMELAKKSGLWVLGTSEHASEPLSSVDRQRDWLVVVGNEEKGLKRLTLENCDETRSIQGRGSVDSLNVSVATGIVLGHLAGA